MWYDFSFLYGSRPSNEIFALESEKTDGNVRTRVFSYNGLKVTNITTFYPNFDAREWVNYFENVGKCRTEIISRLYDCDVNTGIPSGERRTPKAWLYDVKENVRLYAPHGSDLHGCEFYSDPFAFREGHFPLQFMGGDRRRYSTVGGRSCDGQAPFFNIHKNGSGVIYAVGWTGQWNAEVSGEPDGVHFRSGLEDCEFYLNPGEKIRTSSAVEMKYEGDVVSSQNKWRSFLRKYISPVGKNGRDKYAPICANLWGGMTSDECVRRIDAIDKYGVEVDHVWMDAGWYGMSAAFSPDEFEGDWFSYTGDWRVNPNNHPDGLLDVSEKIHGTGRKFILWFEPERVRKNAPIYNEHPEYLLSNPADPDNMLLNLGDEKAWDYCFETVSAVISKVGVDWYRQDFNFEPLWYWRKNDTEGRKGISEIKYINGLYRFFDALLDRFPGLMIDNCASGGRRIDIETLKRSVPLWHSDCQCSANTPPEVAQMQLLTYGAWMPHFGTSTGRLYDTYYARSGYYPATATGYSFSQKDAFGDDENKMKWMRDTVNEAKRVRPYFDGDLYPLTLPSDALDTWSAYQLNRAENGDGLIMMFRRELSPYETSCFALSGLESGANYVFTDSDTGESFTLSGEEAGKGVTFKMTEKRSSKLYFYKKA